MVSASDSKFQVPNTPDLPAGTSPDRTPWVPGTFDSAKLDENQHEKNYYGVLTYQKSAGGLDGQLSLFARTSRTRPATSISTASPATSHGN